MTQLEIKQALKKAYTVCSDAAVQAGNDIFFKNFNDKWSIGENLIHLSKAAKSFNNALKMPKEQILAAFGIANHPSKSYDEVYELYQQKLSERVIVAPNFIGQYTEGDTLDNTIARYTQQHEDLITNLTLFTENELDSLQVPHPLLGNLTFREMYEFMIFHIKHHQKAVERILEVQV